MSYYVHAVLITHNISYYSVMCYVMSCHVMPCHVMPCHVMSCHVMSCHVMSCHVAHGRTIRDRHMHAFVLDPYMQAEKSDVAARLLKIERHGCRGRPIRSSRPQCHFIGKCQTGTLPAHSAHVRAVEPVPDSPDVLVMSASHLSRLPCAAGSCAPGGAVEAPQLHEFGGCSEFSRDGSGAGRQRHRHLL